MWVRVHVRTGACPNIGWTGSGPRGLLENVSIMPRPHVPPLQKTAGSPCDVRPLVNHLDSHPRTKIATYKKTCSRHTCTQPTTTTPTENRAPHLPPTGGQQLPARLLQAIKSTGSLSPERTAAWAEWVSFYQARCALHCRETVHIVPGVMFMARAPSAASPTEVSTLLGSYLYRVILKTFRRIAYAPTGCRSVCCRSFEVTHCKANRESESLQIIATKRERQAPNTAL